MFSAAKFRFWALSSSSLVTCRDAFGPHIDVCERVPQGNITDPETGRLIGYDGTAHGHELFLCTESRSSLVIDPITGKKTRQPKKFYFNSI